MHGEIEIRGPLFAEYSVAECHRAEARTASSNNHRPGTVTTGTTNGNSTLSRTEETTSILSDSEGSTLLPPGPKKEPPKPSSAPLADLRMEIESGILSLRSDVAAERDRKINPEFEDV